MRHAATLRAVLRTPMGAAALAGVAVLVLVAIFAPILLHGPATETNVAIANQDGSSAHLVGTDALGRDILARVLVATRLSLELAVLATLIGTLIGVPLGALPAVVGRRTGRLVSAGVNLTVAFPGTLLALFLAVVFGVGAEGATLAIGIAIAPGVARLTQTLAMSVAGADYIAASRLLGVGRVRLLGRHVLPNIAEPVLISATTAIGSSLLAFAGLSFLGFGVQAPDYDWGRLLNEGLSRIYLAPAAALAPGIAVLLAGIVFTLLGETAAQVAGLREPLRGARRRGRAWWRRGRDDAATEVAAAPAAPVAAGPAAALAVEGLNVSFDGLYAVRDLSLRLEPGEIVGVVGESGSGKSLTTLAIAGLVPPSGEVSAERIELCGLDPRAAGPAECRELLGTSLAVVFQDPMTALNPTLRVGRQLAEVVEVHGDSGRREAMEQATERLRDVRIPRPEERVMQYPHELSGGMRQRAVIGMGLMGEPAVVLADEPTTALDVTVQQQVLELLCRVRDERGAAILLVSHDIAVVAQYASRVLVMYAGRIVEELPTAALPEAAAHPYTRALLASTPDMATDRAAPLGTIRGRPPSLDDVPAGCPFAPRCPFAQDRCRAERPELEPVGPAQRAACWYPQRDTITPRAVPFVGYADKRNSSAEGVA